MSNDKETVEPTTTLTRIWLLTNCPSPYQVELLQGLRQQPDIDLNVRFMQGGFRGSKTTRPLDGLQYKVLRWIGLPGGRDELRVHPGALWEVWRGQFDSFVLSGLYTSPTFLMCAFILWLRRKRIFLWLERPHLRPMDDLPKWKRFLMTNKSRLRSLVLNRLFAISSKVICIGSLAAKQYQQLGLPEDKVGIVPYCSDTSRFQNIDASVREQMRANLRIEDEFVFLFSGQLIERKGVDLLLAAYAKVVEASSHVVLLILGDGVMRAELEGIAKGIEGGRVLFLGHQPQEKLPAIFAAADVFVFPSRHDGWGVVLNEACAAGLPIIASEETGAAHDLVHEGQNGFRIAACLTERWQERMLKLISDSEQRTSFGHYSERLATQCSTQTGSVNMVRILSQTR